MFSFRKKDLIGIDIGSSLIKLVQLKESKEGYHLVKVGMKSLPAGAIVDRSIMDPAPVVEAVCDLVKSLGIKVRQAACSVSGNSVIIKKISFPGMTVDEIEEQVQWEAEHYIPFDINDVNIDFHVLGPDEVDPAQMNVLLVASKKDVISDYISLFDRAGINLTVLDVDSFAVQNAFEMNYNPSPDDVVALVNIGSSVMNINIVKGGESHFTRDVPMGGNFYTNAIQKKLEVKEDEAEKLKVSAIVASDETLRDTIVQSNEALALELYRSVEFYNDDAGGHRITKVYISGGCSKAPFLLNAIQNRLHVPVEIINPFQNVICSDKQFVPGYLKEVGPHVAVAVGLAMRRYADK